MRSARVIHAVSTHAEGEVGDVIVGGVEAPPGETLWQQRDFIAADGELRDILLNEPRGGVFRHVNLLVPPKHPDARMGFIIIEPEDCPPMSGSNAICVATVLLDTGILPIEEPVTRFCLEAPGGLVPVRADCSGGKAKRITIRNLPSFADRLDAELDVPGIGKILVDTAYGGDSFVVVDAVSLGFELAAQEARRVAETGSRITEAANAQLRFRHPELPGRGGISFCLFAGQTVPAAAGLRTRSAVVVRPGRVDRSPTGTAVSARMALLHARGKLQAGETLVAESIIGSEFCGRIAAATTVGGKPAIVPEISGRAWITGVHQHMLDPADPWPRGFRIPDTWGVR